DRGALEAAAALLAAGGWEVGAPQETCCGGVHAQAGRSAKAQGCQRQLQTEARDGEVLLTTASACALELGGDAPAEAGAFLLAHAENLPAGKAAAAEFDVFVHLPCTQRRLAGGGGWVAELLRRIPGARIRMLPGNETCCGAGGLTAFAEPETAATLGRRKAQAAAEELGPGAVIATSNYACRCQLGAALRAAGLANKITDPYSLLARSLAA
ncbi:MAG: (Fe-S)-binding protein, partial [Betaproteobacteria bacterium AqS2]|nr:(Fe-S)-binding protein [Betaproteobacteria bacterium AqS2]